jgi:hypothetical protein
LTSVPLLSVKVFVAGRGLSDRAGEVRAGGELTLRFAVDLRVWSVRVVSLAAGSWIAGLT